MTNAADYNEPALLQALAAGSVDAFDTLYFRYYEAVRANIFKILRDDASTDDMLQEVFVSLWHKRARFASYGRINGWLFVASYNRCMNLLRQRTAERLRVQAVSRMAQDDSSAEELQELQIQLLEAAIQQLPPQRRKVFELCRLQGLTYDQAAEALSISKNTVKDHLIKGGESIRAYLRDHGAAGAALSAAMLYYL